MKLFTPDYYVESYRALDLERLKRQGIRAARLRHRQHAGPRTTMPAA